MIVHRCDTIRKQMSNHAGFIRKVKGKAFQLQAWTGPEGSRRLKMVKLSPPAAFFPQEIFLVPNSVSGWVDPRTIARPEWLCRKIPVSPSGIEPATFPPVAQRHRVLRLCFQWAYQLIAWRYSTLTVTFRGYMTTQSICSTRHVVNSAVTWCSFTWDMLLRYSFTDAWNCILCWTNATYINGQEVIIQPQLLRYLKHSFFT